MLRVIVGRARRWWRDRGLLVGPAWIYIDVSRLIPVLAPTPMPFSALMAVPGERVLVNWMEC